MAILAAAYEGYGVDFFRSVPMAIGAGKEPPPESVPAERIDNDASMQQLGALMAGTGFGRK